MKTIVGLYKSVDEANKVKTALTSQGYDASAITVIDQTSGGYGSGTDSSYGSDFTDSTTTDLGPGTGAGVGVGSGSTMGSGYNTTNQQHETVGARIKNFFGSLTGSDDQVHQSYEQGITNGGALLAVTVADGEAERTADLLHQHGASEIEGGYGTSSSYGQTGSYAASNTATLSDAGEQVIPVVEEELQVGKRQVERGGVRIYSRVVSEPVSESVSLHDERVVVDRRAVDRPATEADFTNTGAVEVRATGEEAVVGKRSRVVEEILVGKEASDRTEEISDTVRHTEVDVEPTVAETTTTTGSKGFDRR